MGLGLDEPRYRLIEGVHEHRPGPRTRVRGWDVPEFLLKGRGHQDRTVTLHREIAQRVVPRKDGYRGELRPRQLLRLHGLLPVGSRRFGAGRDGLIEADHSRAAVTMRFAILRFFLGRRCCCSRPGSLSAPWVFGM